MNDTSIKKSNLQLLSIKDVLKLFCISENTLKRYITSEPSFPKPIRLTPNARRVFFLEEEIHNWIDSRKDNSIQA